MEDLGRDEPIYGVITTEGGFWVIDLTATGRDKIGRIVGCVREIGIIGTCGNVRVSVDLTDSGFTTMEGTGCDKSTDV